jgi:hypothetical protein
MVVANVGCTYTHALGHRIKISNRRATQRCNMSAFFYAKICSLLARRRSSQPVQHVYWPENVIDWLGKWRPTCVMRHARGQKLQSFRRKWPFYMDLYSMTGCCKSMGNFLSKTCCAVSCPRFKHRLGDHEIYVNLYCTCHNIRILYTLFDGF